MPAVTLDIRLTRAVLATLMGIAATAGAGCGDSSVKVRRTNSATAAPIEAARDADKDNDVGAPSDDVNHDNFFRDGHPASARDRRAISALIGRYYAAAIAGDGDRACAMLETTAANDAAANLGGDAGPPYLRGGRTCKEIALRLFAHFHPQLVAEKGRPTVAAVRVAGARGLVLLSFGALPQRWISVQRQNGRWTIGALLDSELP